MWLCHRAPCETLLGSSWGNFLMQIWAFLRLDPGPVNSGRSEEGCYEIHDYELFNPISHKRALQCNSIIIHFHNAFYNLRSIPGILLRWLVEAMASRVRQFLSWFGRTGGFPRRVVVVPSGVSGVLVHPGVGGPYLSLYSDLPITFRNLVLLSSVSPEVGSAV